MLRNVPVSWLGISLGASAIVFVPQLDSCWSAELVTPAVESDSVRLICKQHPKPEEGGFGKWVSVMPQKLIKLFNFFEKRNNFWCSCVACCRFFTSFLCRIFGCYWLQWSKLQCVRVLLEVHTKKAMKWLADRLYNATNCFFVFFALLFYIKCCSVAVTITAVKIILFAATSHL